MASLDAANGVSAASPPDADTIAIPSTLSFANAMAPFTLTVLGFAGDPFADPMALASSYSGSITFSADVPPSPNPRRSADAGGPGSDGTVRPQAQDECPAACLSKGVARRDRRGAGGASVHEAEP